MHHHAHRQPPKCIRLYKRADAAPMQSTSKLGNNGTKGARAAGHGGAGKYTPMGESAGGTNVPGKLVTGGRKRQRTYPTLGVTTRSPVWPGAKLNPGTLSGTPRYATRSLKACDP